MGTHEVDGSTVVRLTRKARALVREHEGVILHSMWCGKCDGRGEAIALLYAAGYTEDDFLQEVFDRLTREAADGAPGR